MPRKIWDTKADFDGAYSIRLARYREEYPGIADDEPNANYDRRALFNASSTWPVGAGTMPQLDFVTPEWERILAHFGWPLSTSICIVGAGFGWAIEYLNDQGYADVWGADNSVYIQGAKDETDPSDGVKRSLVASRVRNENLVTPGDVKRFLRHTGHRNGQGGEEPFDVVITERVLSSLEDAEAQFVSFQIRSLNIVKPTGQVLHIEVSAEAGTGDPSFNFHTL